MNLLLLLCESVYAINLMLSHAPILVDCLFSMTLQGAPSTRVCMSIHPRGKPRSDIGSSRVLNDPPPRQTATVGGTLDDMLDADLGDSAAPVIVIRANAMNPGETYVLRCDVLFRDIGATTGGRVGTLVRFWA